MKYHTAVEEFETIWDGRRDAPHGGYLACEPEQRKDPPAPGLHHSGHAVEMHSDTTLDRTIRRGHFAEDGE